MPTFPSLRDARKQRDAIIYSDAACTVKATLIADNGSPINNSQIVADERGLWPVFTCSSPRVYFRANDGTIHTLYPSSPTKIPTVTGSSGANAALASLLTALAAQGIIVDSSS